MIPTARTRFQLHHFVLLSTVRSLSTFGQLLPATSEIHPSGYVLFTGSSGFMKSQASLSLEEILSVAEEWI